ncbi:MAG: sugar phosphate isomerase/epimerase [Armatimonadota bacterium]|nr:MAG: sugar phosphate isomerase/epimerase [Armatimonadota bacterium]
MKLSIVVSAQPTKFGAATLKGDFEENLARIAELGYDGVEPAVRDPSVVDQEGLLAAIRRYDLEAPAIGTGQAWGEEGLSFSDRDAGVRRTAIDRVKSHLPLAAEAGSMIIIGLIRGTVKPGVGRDQAIDWMVEALGECCEAAAPLGVRLVVEPLNRYETALVNTAGEGLELIRRVGADNLGLLLDTFHMNIEEPSIEESMRLAGDRMFHFHVADSNRWYPGAGHLDFRGILGLLKELGYAGYVSGEFLPMPDALMAAGRAISHLQEVMPSNGGK